MNTWDACEQSWKNGYEEGIHEMAKYVANCMSNFYALNKDELYDCIIKDFKTYSEVKND